MKIRLLSWWNCCRTVSCLLDHLTACRWRRACEAHNRCITGEKVDG